MSETKGSVFDKLTDTSKYTGTHKQRFDADGKGKGAEGRSDRVEADGYVDGFKKKKASANRPLSGKESSVVSRLTDPKKYTGSHKNRFDEDGKGKGIDGRSDRVEADGYVDGFKKANKTKDSSSKEDKQPAIFDRLTNPKLYTGSHKSRFDEDGKGKGINQIKDRQQITGLQDITRPNLQTSKPATKSTGKAPGSKSTTPREAPSGSTSARSEGGSIFDRLNNPKNFTGTHKNRFDEDGKGRGKEGRSDAVDPNGYVNGYKHKDSFDQK